MTRNRLKHKTLEALIEIYRSEGDNPPHYGAEYFFRLDEILKLKGDKKLIGICYGLAGNKDIKMYDNDERNTLLIITDQGRFSYYEKVYLNKIWYRNKNFWIYIVSLSISVAALIVSIFAIND